MENQNLNDMNNPTINVYQNIPAQNRRQPIQHIIIAQPSKPNQYVVPTTTNQVNNVNLYDKKFRLEPTVINCPFCQQNVTTNVERSFSCCACCIFMFTGLILFICIQVIRGKDILCQNAVHYCPYCKNKVGIYNAIY